MADSFSKVSFSRKSSGSALSTKIPSVDVSNERPLSDKNASINYREEVVLLFFNSLLEHIVAEYNTVSEEKPMENVADKSINTEVKDFKDLSTDDLKNSTISSAVGSKVSLSLKTKGKSSRESTGDFAKKLSKTSKESSQSTIKTQTSLRRRSGNKGSNRTSTNVVVGSAAEDSSSFSTSNDWMVAGEREEVFIRFKNGNCYRGPILRKRMDGAGTFTWSDGTCYEGEFCKGDMTGKGKLVYSDNSYYIGSVCKGLLHGEGCMYVGSTFMIYSGMWKAGKKNGKAAIPCKGWLLYFPGNWYDGEWCDDLRQGNGLRQYSKSSSYQGSWYQGKRQGQGTMVWSNSDYYKGEWSVGTMTGYGKYVWRAFLNNTLTFPITNNYQGYWFNGMRNGRGMLYFGYNGGARMAGYWINNMKHGPGIVICGNGKIVQRKPLFLYDKPIFLHSWSSVECASLRDYGRRNCSNSLLKQDVCESSVLTGSLSTRNTQSESRKFIEISEFPEKLSKQMVPLSIPVHSGAEQVDITYFLQKAAQKYTANRTNNEEENTNEGRPDQNDVLAFEENKFRVTLRSNFLILQNLFNQYATIATREKINFKCVLVRLLLWQMYIDIDINNKGYTIIDTDLILNENPSSGVETDHHPFEQIYFWQFLLSLLGVAWAIYSPTIEPPSSEGILATSFQKFLHNDVLPNAGRLTGFALCEFTNLLPIQSVYKLYTSIGEPHTARQFINFCLKYEGQPRCYEKIFESENIFHAKRGTNFTSVGENVIYLPDELPLGQKPEEDVPYPFDDNLARENLHAFVRMKPRKLIMCIGKICPQIIEDDVIVNLDYNISFLEFLNIILSVAFTIVTDLKRRQMKLREREERNRMLSEEGVREALGTKLSKHSKKGNLKEKRGKK